ncbi:hypothetical protein KW460_01880 [Vibrio fluvialis]|nr:hypothetical protein [Vibrio fluvialis]
MMIINLAQAYLRSDQKDKSKQVLNRYDWSATGYEFKLAVAVLNNEHSDAAKLLKTVVVAGDLTEEEVIEWPLFKEFRKTDEFLCVFKELFNKDYAEQEELIKEEFNNHMDKVFKFSDQSISDNDLAVAEEDIENIESTVHELEQKLGSKSA